MTANAARPCPACTSTASHASGVKDGHAMVRCNGCGTLFTRDTVAVETLHDVYDGYYDEGNLAVPAFVVTRLDEIVATFASHRTHGRLLDVGFGAGTLLEAARRAGWTPSGVEVSERAVADAAARGLDVKCGTLADARYPDGAFDVVTAVEVLEHLTDPVAVLREIARILRPGGLLWATTPHGRGISGRMLGTRWSVVSPPEHIQLFSRGGMRRLLERSGFRSVRLSVQGVNPREIVDQLRGKDVRPADRVGTSYQLNEFFTSSPSRRMLKHTANAVLAAVRLGDSLKIHATT